MSDCFVLYLLLTCMKKKTSGADKFTNNNLSTSTCQIPEFDNDLVRRLISTIKVESSEKLLIQFQSGIVMEQEIRYE